MCAHPFRRLVSSSGLNLPPVRVAVFVRRPTILGTLALLSLVGSGCASAGYRSADKARQNRAASYVVEVTNRNWQDMHVYATKGTATYRLGSVGGNESRTLRLPAGFVGRLGGIRLAVRPAGQRELHYSPLVDLAPDQILGWSLEPDLDLSFHWVR